MKPSETEAEYIAKTEFEKTALIIALHSVYKVYLA